MVVRARGIALRRAPFEHVKPGNLEELFALLGAEHGVVLYLKNEAAARANLLHKTPYIGAG